jgi:hypothetical protein
MVDAQASAPPEVPLAIVLVSSMAPKAAAAQDLELNLIVLHAVVEQLRPIGQDHLLVAVRAAIQADKRRAAGRRQPRPSPRLCCQQNH